MQPIICLTVFASRILIAVFFVFSGIYNPLSAQWVTPYKVGDSIAAIKQLKIGDAHFTASRYDSAIFYYDKMEQFSQQKKFYRGYMEAIFGKASAYHNLQDYPKAEQYIRLAIDEAKRMNDPFLYAYGLGELARARMRTDRLDEAIQYFKQSIDIYFSKVPSEEGAEIYGELAFTYGLKGQYDKEIEHRIKSIEIIEKHFPQSDRLLGVKYSNLGNAYFNTNNRQKAIEYLKKAAVIREKYKQISGLAATYGNLSKVYVELDTTEARRYLDLCKKNALQSNEERWIVFYHNRAMDFYQFTGRPLKAMEHQLKLIRILEKSKRDPAELGMGYLHAAVLARKNGMDSETIKKYFESSNVLIQQTTTYQKKNFREYYRELSGFDSMQGNFKDAYAHYRSYIIYRDSLTNEKIKKDFSEITVRYEAAKKDNEIQKLNTERRIRELQIEKQNAIIAGNKAEAERKQKEIDLLAKEQTLRNLKLQQQEKELERHELLINNKEQQLQLAQQQKEFADKEITTQKKLLSTQKQVRNIGLVAFGLLALLAYFLFNRYQLKKKVEQQEVMLAVRNDIAKNLHDEIGSTLTSIKILSEVSKTNLQNNPQKAEQFIDRITEQSESMQQGMSDIVWAITPDNDKLENMLVRMREYVSHTLEPKGVKTVFKIHENTLSKTIGMKQRKDFFLVFKEAVNNIAKHADASEVIIDLSENNNNISLKVTDNGVGFDTGKATSSNGLKNIKSRAALLGGFHSIESKPGKGSTIAIEVPAT